MQFIDIFRIKISYIFGGFTIESASHAFKHSIIGQLCTWGGGVYLFSEAMERANIRSLSRAAVRLFLGALATFLTYVSSLFNTGAFLVALALLAPKARWRIVALWLLAALLVVFGMYGNFTVSFVTEIVPAILKGAGNAVQGNSPAGPTAVGPEAPALVVAFSRIVFFSGYGFPLLALAGFALSFRRADPAATVLKAYGLAFLGLVVLRGVSFGLFRDMKELEYAGPAFAVFAAVALRSVERPLARWLITAGLVLTGVVMQYGYFERWSRLVLG